MNTRATTSAAAFEAASSDVQPVEVTRWTARLVDPQCERDYRAHRFPDDRRRVLVLLGLVAAASVLSTLVELQTYAHGGSRLAALVPPFASILLPLLGFGVFMHVNAPRTLEWLLPPALAVGMVVRLSILTLNPGMAAMWPTMMVGIVLVIYLYLPLRLTVAFALAGTFSLVAPVWWSMAQGAALPQEQFYRSLIWLLLANASGFTAGNSLQRSLRTQFAQGLVLRHLLSTDALTGIANRRRFDDALEREWRRCARAGAPLSLLMIDIDHFKTYNDHWGHQQGDDCLRQVARLLVNAAGRPGDVVARYGGEEFVCLLPEVGPAGAHAVAMRFAAAVERADIAHPRSPTAPRITLSVGVATARDLSGEPGALMALADKLLYAAKNAGRDRIAAGEWGGATAVARAA